MSTINLILASGSPRRRQLVGLLGYPFTVVVSGADEDEHLSAPPPEYVRHTARAKAEAVAATLAPAPNAARRVLIAADTTVALEGAILGKPATPAEARAMLLALGGRDHDVYTAVCVLDLADGRALDTVSHAVVTMRDYRPAEIDAYVATGEPLQVAGGFTIDGRGGAFIERIEGDHLNVVGLSLPLLRRMVTALRVSWPTLWSDAAP